MTLKAAGTEAKLSGGIAQFGSGATEPELKNKKPIVEDS